MLIAQPATGAGLAGPAAKQPSWIVATEESPRHARARPLGLEHVAVAAERTIGIYVTPWSAISARCQRAPT
jgi:hypothetical protein